MFPSVAHKDHFSQKNMRMKGNPPINLINMHYRVLFGWWQKRFWREKIVNEKKALHQYFIIKFIMILVSVPKPFLLQ